jgi:hypothetical protein
MLPRIPSPTFDVGGQLHDLLPFIKGKKDSDFIG